jgi:hypothetical protein
MLDGLNVRWGIRFHNHAGAKFMKSTIPWIVSLFLTVASLAFAQTPGANSQVPEDAFSTRPLIAWSSMQKPQPTPQPLPHSETIPEPGQQQGQTDYHASTSTFVGHIVRAGEIYVLEADGGTSYPLVTMADVSRFENRSVRIDGELDARTKSIHIIGITVLT